MQKIGIPAPVCNVWALSCADTPAGGVAGVLSAIPEIRLPEIPEAIRPPQASRSSTFRIIYLDDDLRISRGDRGETRVFIRT